LRKNFNCVPVLALRLDLNDYLSMAFWCLL